MKLTVKGLNVTMEGNNRLSLDEVSVELQTSEINDVISNIANLAKQFGFNAENIVREYINEQPNFVKKYDTKRNPYKKHIKFLSDDVHTYELIKAHIIPLFPIVKDIDICTDITKLMYNRTLYDTHIKSHDLHDLIIALLRYLKSKQISKFERAVCLYEKIFGNTNKVEFMEAVQKCVKIC